MLNVRACSVGKSQAQPASSNCPPLSAEIGAGWRRRATSTDLLISDERGWEGSVAKLCDLSMRSTRKVGGRRAIGVRIERILK
jgi:hypothetical protein